MCLIKKFKEWRHRRRERIYEGPEMDGGTRIRRDVDAPLEIISRELVKFECTYSALSLIDDDTLLRGVYTFSASVQGNGCTVSYGVSTHSGSSVCEPRPAQLLCDIEELIRRYNVSQHNGRYYKVSGLPDFFGASVEAEFASGEYISCYNNQDPFLPAEMIRELWLLFSECERKGK